MCQIIRFCDYEQRITAPMPKDIEGTLKLFPIDSIVRWGSPSEAFEYMRRWRDVNQKRVKA